MRKPQGEIPTKSQTQWGTGAERQARYGAGKLKGTRKQPGSKQSGSQKQLKPTGADHNHPYLPGVTLWTKAWDGDFVQAWRWNMLLGGRAWRVRSLCFSGLFPQTCNREFAHGDARSFGLRICSIIKPTVFKISGKVLGVDGLILVRKTLTSSVLNKKRSRPKNKGSSMVLPNGQLQFITGLEFIRNVQTSGLHTIRSEISFRSEKNILQKNPSNFKQWCHQRTNTNIFVYPGIWLLKSFQN